MHKHQLITVVGNRPQFIKMAPVSHAIAVRGHQEIVVHTGQHYDDNLSDIFFRELGIKAPDIQLKVSGKTHGAMTAELLAKIEPIFMDLEPSGLLVYGDTNSTLAAVLAAVKLHIPVAHIEAGPRMNDMTMPEEVNRIMVDHVSSLLFAPDAPSVENLKREGISVPVYLAGDVMLDTFNLCKQRAKTEATLLQHPRLANNAANNANFIFMTLHRPANVDSEACLQKLYQFIASYEGLIVFPAHPRTLARMKAFSLYEAFAALPNLLLTEPLGYLDTIAALMHAQYVITDSGGLQKEAYFARTLALVLLKETPWPELRDSGWQHVIGGLEHCDLSSALATLKNAAIPTSAPDFYGKGNAASIIVDALEQHQFFGHLAR